jgi:hypothetical protein
MGPTTRMAALHALFPFRPGLSSKQAVGAIMVLVVSLRTLALMKCTKVLIPFLSLFLLL